MSAKRRADGPAVTRTPKRPGVARQRLRRVLKWFLIVALVGTLILIGGFVYLYKTIQIPSPNKDFQTQTSFVYYADGKTQLGQYAKQNREIIPLSDMPQHLQDAVVAAEDRTFYSNSGIDPKGIIRAAFNDARGGPTQGASTITQQYVKILYLNQERSLTRKIHEAILSLKIQKQQSKDEILTGYLNTIYFGRGAYGVQAAAKAYFGVDAKALTLKQSAVLASVLNNPSQFDPANGKSNKRALKARYAYVLDGMAKMGTIPAAKATQAARHLPPFPVFRESSQYGGQRGHVLTLVRQQLHNLDFTDSQIDGGGLRITTTLTARAMNAARRGALQVRPNISDKFLHVAVASVQPGTGDLVGFFGGQDFLRSQINWAEAGGMVGSTFKPVSLAAAITDGYSLKSTWDGNSPFTFPDGLEVHNEGAPPGTSYGSSVTSVYALEQSINTAFVDMSNSMKNGPQKILAMANKMGIPPAQADPHYPGIPSSTTDLAPDALITLGKSRVSAINMANTYATIANGGVRADVHVIDKVTDSTGKVLYQYKPHVTEAVDPDIDKDVSYAMQQVVLHGTGTNAQALGRPAAGKTGTATNDANQVSSSWFVGFTPQLSTAVMYVRGNGNGQLDGGWLPPYNGAAGYFGAGYPTATWAAVMKADLAGEPVMNLPLPANVPAHAPEPGHDPTTAPPPPPPSTHHTSAPPTSSASSSAPSSSPPSSSQTTTSPATSATTTPPSSSPTATISLPTPTGTGGTTPSARPMARQESWW
ncbi:transglycosylase domain-containing protein [Nocardioides cynanchi]|uniref:transglycosylase domain-containing protein n=1 Tax=Nocardioides cynanchi TaxID=2558918 RepID=UPI001EE24F6F|nr:transglycosylase domain-containing protein [Nocardioides cynanchi]